VLGTMADECDIESSELVTTRGKVVAELPSLKCQLDKTLLRRLTWSTKCRKIKHCTINQDSDSAHLSGSRDDCQLLEIVLSHISEAGCMNADWARAAGLRRITAVDSAGASFAFATHLANLSRRCHWTEGWLSPGPFQAKWMDPVFQRYGPQDELSQDSKMQDWRWQVWNRFKEQPSRTHELCRWARVVTVFHACRNEETALNICSTGFVALAMRDSGFYGHGIYFSADLAYAAGIYGRKMRDKDAAGLGDPCGTVTVLVCDVAVGLPHEYNFES
jgi:hypothetical protein